jgi:hypothetical protein
VLQGVNGGLVVHGFLVEAAVLPDGVVLAPCRRALRVVHGPLGVLTGRAYIVGLDLAGGTARRLLPSVQHHHNGGGTDHGHHDCHHDHQSPRAAYPLRCLAAEAAALLANTLTPFSRVSVPLGAYPRGRGDVPQAPRWLRSTPSGSEISEGEEDRARGTSR